MFVFSFMVDFSSCGSIACIFELKYLLVSICIEDDSLGGGGAIYVVVDSLCVQVNEVVLLSEHTSSAVYSLLRGHDRELILTVTRQDHH